ncbi:PTS sugar transporter subunit IIB [Bombilactobacillus bombi]|jgi:ascorbate PTS system EIIB component|uniref:PTS sugar transporter subunit IIB n=1 Tax=Bombilactobacillus bombi TaxID=1303590 RepID=UPI000E58761D|nr:PTS sugar transporter subunit IIB [Bombilactobacillus bombi]AXX65367.1 PTS sugar transporter subunit IIB [Bombilactobacillus bombi]
MSKIYSALIACRTGMGSSMMLKIKVNQVVRENKFPFDVAHDVIDAAKGINPDLLITMEDLVPDVKGEVRNIIGIKDLTDKAEIKEKLQKFLNDQNDNS